MKTTDSKHRLKELLNLSGDSQNEMARKSGLTKSAISNYINGSREPRQDAILYLSKAYNVNPAWLMGLDVPRVIETKKDNKDSLNIKALELYNLYENATPEARELVENFLKSSQQKK